MTRLASGLPVGADLEYADELTLRPRFRRADAPCEPRAGRIISTPRDFSIRNVLGP